MEEDILTLGGGPDLNGGHRNVLRDSARETSSQASLCDGASHLVRQRTVELAGNQRRRVMYGTREATHWHVLLHELSGKQPARWVPLNLTGSEHQPLGYPMC